MLIRPTIRTVTSLTNLAVLAALRSASSSSRGSNSGLSLDSSANVQRFQSEEVEEKIQVEEEQLTEVPEELEYEDESHEDRIFERNTNRDKSIRSIGLYLSEICIKNRKIQGDEKKSSLGIFDSPTQQPIDLFLNVLIDELDNKFKNMESEIKSEHLMKMLVILLRFTENGKTLTFHNVNKIISAILLIICKKDTEINKEAQLIRCDLNEAFAQLVGLTATTLVLLEENISNKLNNNLFVSSTDLLNTEQELQELEQSDKKDSQPKYVEDTSGFEYALLPGVPFGSK